MDLFFYKSCIMKKVKKMNKNVQIEICCGSIQDVITASAFPIDRIELNCALELGGLTPTISTLRMAKETTHIPMMCMVRPRCAGFVYTESQIENMFKDAQMLLDEKADGIVFGFLNDDHTIDRINTNKMVQLIHSYGKEAIFHKAFDECLDMDEAIQTLIECHVDRILSGGGKCSILEGSEHLARLQNRYGEQIQLLIGGGITPENIKEVHQKSQLSQLHMTAKRKCFDDGDYVAVDEETLRRALKQLNI